MVTSGGSVQAKTISETMRALKEQGRCVRGPGATDIPRTVALHAHSIYYPLCTCRVAFIPFLVAYDPDRASTIEALRRLDQVGASVIELGVPYSDPLADGPVIQAAATRALEKKTKLEDVLSLVAEVAPTLSAPILLFVYYNPILARGLENFCAQVAIAGAKGAEQLRLHGGEVLE